MSDDATHEEQFMEESQRERYRGIIQELLVARHWGLVVDLDDFVDKVCNRISNGIQGAKYEMDAAALATAREYGTVLYNACSGTDTALQRRAFEETYQRFYANALEDIREPGLAQELAQKAVDKMWESLKRPRQPDRFLTYTRRIIVRVILDEIERLQTQGKYLVPLRQDYSSADAEFTDDEYDKPVGTEDIVEKGKEMAVRPVLDQEYRQEMLAIIKHCVRSPRQRAVLIALFVEGDSYDDIVQEMKITTEYAYQLRYQGLNKLRNCAKFVSYLKGIRPLEGPGA